MGGKQKRARFAANANVPIELRRAVVDAKKTNDVKAALAAFKAMVDQEVQVPFDLANVVLSTLVSADALDASLLDEVLQVYEKTKEINEKPDEAFFTTAARVLLKLDAFDKAMDVIKEMKDYGHMPRHRTYSPLLAKACEDPGRLHLARTIYQEMIAAQSSDLLFEDDVSVVVEACARSQRDPNTHSSSSDDATYAVDQDLLPVERLEWVEEVLRDCVKRATEPPSERLINAARDFFSANNPMCKDAKPQPLDAENRCQCCGAAMKSVEPDAEQLELILKQTEALAPLQTPAKKVDWEKFLGWEQRNIQKFDTVVDGANISYFRASSTSDPDPRYNQADLVMTKLREMGRKPLLFFHARHFNKRGIPKDLENKWREANCLFVVPHGHNDDVFWLHMSIKMGPRNWMVTNDQMRDHRFEMIQSTCAFARWKERHQTAYDVVWMEAEQKLVASVYPPLTYSVQIQCSDAGKWHFPVQIPPTEEERKAAELKQRLKTLAPTELRKLLLSREITFEQFRDIRREALGCELPKTFGKRYEWLCF